jgi:hypothetical protein
MTRARGVYRTECDVKASLFWETFMRIVLKVFNKNTTFYYSVKHIQSVFSPYYEKIALFITVCLHICHAI